MRGRRFPDDCRLNPDMLTERPKKGPGKPIVSFSLIFIARRYCRPTKHTLHGQIHTRRDHLRNPE